MEQETQIYFLRHGQTNNNREGRMQGRVDIPLNETGRAQARCAAQRLKGIAFDAVYSSPLGRAVETAQIVTGLPTQEINIEPRAVEIDFGVWDNRLHAELEKETEQFDLLWDETDKYVPPQGAEPLEEVMARVRAMLQELAARHAGRRILVTTHGGVQQAVFTIVEQRPLHDMWKNFLGNCGCVAVGVQGDAMRVLRVFPAVQVPQGQAESV